MRQEGAQIWNPRAERSTAGTEGMRGEEKEGEDNGEDGSGRTQRGKAGFLKLLYIFNGQEHIFKRMAHSREENRPFSHRKQAILSSRIGHSLHVIFTHLQLIENQRITTFGFLQKRVIFRL